jgi:hypothetical protein
MSCTSEIDRGQPLGSDVGPASDPRDPSDAPDAGSTVTTTTASACEVGASWGARRDLAFERSKDGAGFADVVNELIRASDVPPIAVSSHMAPGCVWMVAFSATDTAGEAGAEQGTTFTPMLRHPSGLWTAAPQSTGWLRIVDRAGRAVRIPIVAVTGAATYGEVSCASLSEVRVSAAIPPAAADIRLTTSAGERTVRDLMGSAPSAHGWYVRFAFSADMTR